MTDATHQWVNGESLLRTCLIGVLVPDQAKNEGKEKQATQTTQQDETSIDTSFPARDGPQIAKDSST